MDGASQLAETLIGLESNNILVAENNLDLPAQKVIKKLASEIHHFGPCLEQLRVLIEESGRDNYGGRHYLVTLTATGPGGQTLVVTHDSAEERGHGDLSLAIRIAFVTLFRSARRQQKERHEPTTQERNRNVCLP